MADSHYTDSRAPIAGRLMDRDSGSSPSVKFELSVVVPVYGNSASLPQLFAELDALFIEREVAAEVVFVIDGSTDNSVEVLEGRLAGPTSFHVRIVEHARNFGSFPAIRTGLQNARGDMISVIAADLQEPTELVIQFYDELVTGGADIAVGIRRSRADRRRDRWSSQLFWGTYRRLIQPQIPSGGVDVFGCTSVVRDRLCALRESNSSLIGLLFWVGFRRVEVEYDRKAREHGTSGWTLSKKVRYLADSVFAFTDLPVRIMLGLGVFGVVTSIGISTIVAVARIMGLIDVPGYAALMLVMSFFAALNMCALGIVGSYLWRTFENTKQRPEAIAMLIRDFSPDASDIPAP